MENKMYAEKIQKAIEKAEDEHFNGNNEAAEMLEAEAREIAREALANGCKSSQIVDYADINEAELMIWKSAHDVVSSKRSNEATTNEYASGQFDAFCNMALSLGQTTEERIYEIMRMAIKKTY